MPAEAPNERGRFLALVFGLPLLAVALFALLQGPSVPLGDDWKLFVDFDRISFAEAIRTNSQPEHGLRFRPFCYAHVWVERSVLGLPFWACKWIGHAYLALAGSALTLLLVRLGIARVAALAAGVLFVTHPTAVEVHGWATARIDTMASAFGLLGLWLALVPRLPQLLLGLVCLLLAFLCKESAYPLFLMPAVLGFASGLRGRDLVRVSLTGVIALGLVIVIKIAIVGAFFADWWSVQVPLLIRARGYLTYLLPLGLWPVTRDWTGPDPGIIADVLAAAYPVVIAGLLVHGLTNRRKAPDRLRTLALLAGFFVTIAVLGGVPARGDLSGNRLWFLPSAFLLAMLASIVQRRTLFVLLVPGCVLLQLNLAPYREAERRMDVVLTRLDAELPKYDNAVRITDLQRLYGPVPLFFHMVNFYPLLPRFRDHDPRTFPLLTLAARNEAEKRVNAELDRRWRELMRKRGVKHVLELAWDSARGRLVRR